MSLTSQLRSQVSGTGTTSRRCASAAVPPRLRTLVCAAQLWAMTGPPVRFYLAGSAVLPKAPRWWPDRCRWDQF